jgi:hypothetical protein
LRPIQPVFAADGSQAIRSLSSGWTLLVAQALLVGPETEEASLRLCFVRSTVPDPVVKRLAELLMRSLELEVALSQARRMSGGVLCLDGSLQADMPHLLYRLDVDRTDTISEDRDLGELPFRTLSTLLELLQIAEHNGVLLVGISKTSAARFFGQALRGLDGRGVESLPADLSREQEPVPPALSDSELLYRWTDGVGFCQPLVLGVHALGHRRGEVLRSVAAAPERENTRQGVAARMAAAAAIVAFHTRLAQGEPTLRVDVPASALGLPARLGDTYFGWADRSAVVPVLWQLQEGYGGPNVYQASSYVVDRLVRLSRRTVDGPYLSIMRNVTGMAIRYDRSLDRFI